MKSQARSSVQWKYKGTTREIGSIEDREEAEQSGDFMRVTFS